MLIRSWQNLSLAALLLYGSWGFWGAKTAEVLNSRAALIFSSIGTLVVALLCLCLLHFKIEFSAKGILFGILTGLSTGLGTLFFIAAISKGPPVPIVVMTAMYPLVTTLLCIAFLHQAVTLKQIVGIGFSIVGVTLLII